MGPYRTHGLHLLRNEMTGRGFRSMACTLQKRGRDRNGPLSPRPTTFMMTAEYRKYMELPNDQPPCLAFRRV